VDAQRPYSSEPPPWYSDRDDPGRTPGQRDSRYGERYPDDSRFGEDGSYPDDGRHRDAYGAGYPGDDSRFDSGDRFEGADPLFDAPEGARTTQGGRRGPRSGLAMPGDDADPTRDDPSARYRTEMFDRGQLRRPAGEAGPAGPPPGASGPVAPSSTVYQGSGTPTQPLAASRTNEAYRARRSGTAALLGIVAVIAEILLLLRVLANSLTSHPVNPAGVLGGLLAMCGVPLVAIGMYALATGAATAGGPNVGRAWLRTPLAYLPVGLVLLIAAGLAV
jgi:hypothetical protein